MATKQFTKSDLYVYELSGPILDSLRLAHFDNFLREVEPTPEAANKLVTDENAAKDSSVSDVSKCNLCGQVFEDLKANRQHRRTDLHIFNVKRSIRGLPSVDEKSFEALLQGERSLLKSDHSSEVDSSNNSSKGGDSDESDHDDGNGEQPSHLEDFLENEVENISIGEDCTTGSHLSTRSAQMYFHSKLLLDSDVFGVYKTLFTQEQLMKPLETIKGWNNFTDQSTSISALFMVGGGHFAGAIVSHQRANILGNSKKQNDSPQEQAVRFLEHKTFHRYTTRRKQGGSQSAMDQAKGKANSAGSSLRRYNEMALKQDVENLLKEWEPYLAKCENIFVRCHNVNERKIITENQAVKAIEHRVKSFPFTTARPTVSELKRSWCELTYLKKTAKPVPLPIKKPSPTGSEAAQDRPNKSKEPEKEKSLEITHTDELIPLLKKGKAPLLIAYLRKNNLDSNFLLAPQSRYSSTPTMLHYASQHGLKQMVTILISNMRCDPCILNGAGKTAWDLAKNTQVRQAFQLARYKVGEDFTNWFDSHVAEPLSREQIDEINTQEDERKKVEAEAAIKRELESVKERRQTESEVKRGTGRILDSSTVSISQNMNSLTEEQKKRLMREQRARAAEARMQRR